MTSPPSGWAEEEARRFLRDHAEAMITEEYVAATASLLLAAERRGAEAMRERAALLVDFMEFIERTDYYFDGESSNPVTTTSEEETREALAAAIRSLPPGGGA